MLFPSPVEVYIVLTEREHTPNTIFNSQKHQRQSSTNLNIIKKMIEDKSQVFLSVVTVGELRRGVELIRYRGDVRQARQLEKTQ